MTNNIRTTQNDSEQLDRLAAKTVVYQRAEIIQWIMGTLPIINGIAWPIVLYFNFNFQVWATLCSFSIALTGVGLQLLLDHWRCTAASIQELFDIDVLELGESQSVGVKNVAPEAISDWAKSYFRNHDNSKLIDWYPNAVEALPLQAARLLCQRSNCWWDSELRKICKWLIWGTFVIISMIAMIFGILSGFTIEVMTVSIVGPLTPLIIWGVKEHRSQKSAHTDSETMLHTADRLFNEATAQKLSLETALAASRGLQAQIFRRRCSNPVNPTFLYKMTRSRYQSSMNAGASKKAKSYNMEGNLDG